MQLTGRLVLSALLSVAVLCGVATAQERIEPMKLLAPNTGWAATDHQLFWTTDAGRHWRVITPRLTPGQTIDSVFFFDTQRGWALLISQAQGVDQPHFRLAPTRSGGSQWSTVDLKIAGFPSQNNTLTGGSHIYFTDPLHGWINIPVVSSAAFALAELIKTSNGGKDWELSPGGSGTAGSIRFISSTDGWVAGGPGNQHLYETHDGARSWREVLLGTPQQPGKATIPAFEQPPSLRTIAWDFSQFLIPAPTEFRPGSFYLPAPTVEGLGNQKGSCNW